MHLVNNADAVTQPNAIVVKLNVVTTRHRDRLFFVARRCTDFHRRHRRAASASSRLLQFSILAARAITHRTPAKAELFCEICMRDEAAVMIARNAMDAYYCGLFLESRMQLEGERVKDNLSVAFFLTDSLHQFA